MYNITAYLTIKNKTFYTVLTYYVDGIRKMKWISTGFKENESKKKAEKKLIQIRDEFKNKLETIKIPIKPNSSLIIEKIKSVCGSGK